MRGIADQAGVSVKTVEALYRTKAELLKQVIEYAIAGDLRPIPILARESVAAIQAAPDAPTMLDLHARHHALATAPPAATNLRALAQAAPPPQHNARHPAQNPHNRRTAAPGAPTPHHVFNDTATTEIYS
jgi:TetR/AcrR family transcriptional regulator of autoinduction and epiphytic fitness